MVLILSKNPTGDVLSWQMSPERAALSDGGYKYTATIKSYGGNTNKVVFFLKGATKKDLKRVRKWRIISSLVQGDILHLNLTSVGKKEEVNILQMVGRAGRDTNETIISFLSPSEVHAGNNQENSRLLSKQNLQEAALG